jgi:hypothetical protein
MNKLADDLHKADVEIRNARLEVVSARREASEAQQTQQAEQLQSLSVFNGLRHELDTVKAERDAARQLHLVECRKYNAEVERRMALERQVAELTAERDSLKQQVAELTEKLGELPDEEDEPFPEPYDWQVGDEVIRNGEVRSVEVASRGYVKLHGLYSCGAQSDWERAGWGLHRKASDMPDIPRFTEQQTADFKAVMEQVSDSVGTNGEGQS